MSKMMIYALKGAVGGAVENVWGHDMQVMAIDSTNKPAVEAAKANGYTDKPQDIIDQIEAKQMQKENTAIKGQLANSADKARIDELEEQLATALGEIADLLISKEKSETWSNEVTGQNELHRVTIRALRTEISGFASERGEANTVIDEKVARIAELEQKLAVYETAKDTNGDGKVGYDEMTNAELQALLDQRKVEYNKRDGKDVLIQKATDSE